MTPNEITVTAANTETVREGLPCDQAAELIVGCRTWGTYVRGQRGQITVWPDGRCAVCAGGDSVWGDWDDRSGTGTLDAADAAGRPIRAYADGQEESAE